MEVAEPPGFQLIESPDVLRLTKHHVSARFERSELDRAAEHAAGRACAALALASAGASERHVAQNPDRSPRWPAGFVGSITHKGGFVSACAASSADLAGVGLDSEALIPDAVRSELQVTVSRGGELERLALGAELDRAQLFTLLFSAKESVYKCLYPLVLQTFGFQDVELATVDVSARRFRARLTRRLSALAPGVELEGHFQLADGMVHTALELALAHWPATTGRRRGI